MAKKSTSKKALSALPTKLLSLEEQMKVAAEIAAMLSMSGQFVDYDAKSDMKLIRNPYKVQMLRTGADASASNSTLWEDVNTANTPADGRHIGDLNPAMRALGADDFYRASCYPLGSFICHVMPRLAFRNEWRFVEQKDTKAGVVKELAQKLAMLTRKWKIRLTAMTAVELAASLGRSLVYIEEKAKVGNKSQKALRVVPIEEVYIEYEENEIVRFKPIVAWGKNGMKQLDLDPKDCVMFVHNPDPLGNGSEGIPAHFTAYKTIIRKERVTRAYANLIENRGMGLLLAAIKAGNLNAEDMKKWAQQFGNPGSRNVLFYPQQVMDITAVPGINTGFDYVGTDASFTRHGSMATGEPGQRMEGTQTGMVTGGKTDQDNTAEIYKMFHEMHEDSIIALYYLVEPGLEGKDFELDFPNDITMDPLEQANLFQRNVASVLEAAPLITVEKGCMLMDCDVPDGVEPKMLLADYLNEVAQKLTPAPGDPGYQDYMQYEKGVVPASDKFNAQQKQKEQGVASGKPGTKAKNDHMKRPNNSKKAGKDSEDPEDPEEETDQDAMYTAKLDVAQKLVKKMGYKEVDTALTALFGETLDKRVLVRLRNEK